MFLTATNLNAAYLIQTKIWARSLSTFGGVPERQVAVIAFGRDIHECRVIERELRSDFKAMEVVLADLSRPAFAIVAPRIEKSDWPAVTDYLRVWVAHRFRRYVWMDSDIIVKKPIPELLKLVRTTKTLHMASDRVGPEIRAYLLRFYGTLYQEYYGEPPSIPLGADGQPVACNNGVIVVNRSYHDEWRSIFRTLERRAQINKTVKEFFDHPIGLQGVWNLLFWKSSGLLLDSRYNSIPSSYSRSPPLIFSPANVLHYSVKDKSVMFRAAMKLGLL